MYFYSPPKAYACIESGRSQYKLFGWEGTNLQEVTNPGYDNIWLYQIYGKMVGINAEIPLGTVRIQTSSR